MTEGRSDVGRPTGDQPQDLDALRRAVYARGASAADALAFEEAVAQRAATERAAGLRPVSDSARVPIAIDRSPEPLRTPRDHPVSPVPPPDDLPGRDPVGSALSRRRPTRALLGGGLLLAAVTVLAVLALVRTGTATTQPTSATGPTAPAPAPTPSLDPADRSTRFREGSGGAASALAVPAVPGLILIARSDAGGAGASATVDGLGGRLEFAVACAGSGTVTLRVVGGAVPPIICRAGDPVPKHVFVAASAHAVRYTIAMQATARWALAVGRTPAEAGSTAEPSAG